MKKTYLSRETLYKLVWEKPLSHLAKEYQISDSGLRKICIRLKIPLPAQGHWTRVRLGKPFKKPLLPTFTNDEKIFLENRKTGPQSSSEKNKRKNLIIQEIEDFYKELISGNKFIGKKHYLINSLEQELIDRKNDSYGKFDGMWEPSRGELDVRFSRKIKDKALRFLKKFIYIIEDRNHIIIIENNWDSTTYMTINEIKLKISLKERLKIVKENNKPWDSNKYVSTGILYFQYDHYSKKEWTDENESLDVQIPKIIAFLEMKAYELHIEHLEALERRRIQEEKERKIREAIENKNEEFKNFQNLVEHANQWKQSQVLLEYITNIQNTSNEIDESWIKWATNKALWLDPNSGFEDEVLGKYPPEITK